MSAAGRRQAQAHPEVHEPRRHSYELRCQVCGVEASLWISCMEPPKDRIWWCEKHQPKSKETT